MLLLRCPHAIMKKTLQLLLLLTSLLVSPWSVRLCLVLNSDREKPTLSPSHNHQITLASCHFWCRPIYPLRFEICNHVRMRISFRTRLTNVLWIFWTCQRSKHLTYHAVTFIVLRSKDNLVTLSVDRSVVMVSFDKNKLRWMVDGLVCPLVGCWSWRRPHWSRFPNCQADRWRVERERIQQ